VQGDGQIQVVNAGGINAHAGHLGASQGIDDGRVACRFVNKIAGLMQTTVFADSHDHFLTADINTRNVHNSVPRTVLGLL
jgi:hypothetical protein